MVTADEELQAKEFLKRAEIRTMKKDLQALRETDALRERDKIAKIKTLEEQLEEQKKKTAASTIAKAADEKEKAGREQVLTKNAGQERLAEKDLKNYATEEERQQIFLFESQRLHFEKEIDSIDKEKDPALKLEKNKLLLQKRDQQVKLDSILAQEKKLEDEQKFIASKEQTTAIPAEKKGLEQSRWDLDKKIQDIEKKRWEAEKQVQETDAKVTQIDKSSEQLVTEKNSLRDRVLGADKSLREIYSAIMAREEEKRRGLAEEQVARREALSKISAEQKEKVQRQQWSHPARKEPGFLSKAPAAVKEKLSKSAETEGEQRIKFLEEVETLSQKGQGGTTNVAPKQPATPSIPVPLPPVPRKK